MPNLKPPITTTTAAITYRESILKAVPADSNFTPLMTLYLTDTTSPDEIKRASKSSLYLIWYRGILLFVLTCGKALSRSLIVVLQLEAFAVIVCFDLVIHLE